MKQYRKMERCKLSGVGRTAYKSERKTEMAYLMLDVTDKYDYDIHEELVCSKLKALQQQMENYLLADGLYPRFIISEGAFRDGTLCEISTDSIVTLYKKRNGVVVPVMEVW